MDLLDYGCGGSPYRSLFPNARYQRADLAETPDLDFVIDPEDPVIEAPSESFDLILSSQVLEHVPDASSYLKDCLRLLRPGGKLLLTSHGTHHDHAVPHDYRRWTTDGIRWELEQCGFEVVQVQKLTTGLRCLAALAMIFGKEIHRYRFSSYGFPLSALHWLISRSRRGFHRWADRCLDHSRVVAADDREHRLYIGFLAQARKPASD